MREVRTTGVSITLLWQVELAYLQAPSPRPLGRADVPEPFFLSRRRAPRTAPCGDVKPPSSRQTARQPEARGKKGGIFSELGNTSRLKREGT